MVRRKRAGCTTVQPPSCRQPHYYSLLTLRTGCYSSARHSSAFKLDTTSLSWQADTDNPPSTILSFWANNWGPHSEHSDNLIYSVLMWSPVSTTTSYFGLNIKFYPTSVMRISQFLLYIFPASGKKKSCKLCFSSDLMFNLNKRTIKTKLNITQQQQCWPQLAQSYLTSTWHNIRSPPGWFNI